MAYNWQYKDWPQFHYEPAEAEEALYSFSEKLGYVTAALQALPKAVQIETLVDTLVAEALKTSERGNTSAVRTSNPPSATTWA